MKIWIDADATPFDVKEVVFRAARRLKIDTILVANQPLALPPNAPTVSSVTVREGANMADGYIVEHCEVGDIAITADIPLAALLVDKQVHVIDPRGDEYTADNIRSRLSLRDLDDMARWSCYTRSRPYDARDKKAFAAAFDRLLAKRKS
ncbi:MAG: DUF188 domain-containing protein [Pirellulaceae bacterium]